MSGATAGRWRVKRGEERLKIASAGRHRSQLWGNKTLFQKRSIKYSTPKPTHGTLLRVLPERLMDILSVCLVSPKQTQIHFWKKWPVCHFLQNLLLSEPPSCWSALHRKSLPAKFNSIELKFQKPPLASSTRNKFIVYGLSSIQTGNNVYVDWSLLPKETRWFPNPLLQKKTKKKTLIYSSSSSSLFTSVRMKLKLLWSHDLNGLPSSVPGWGIHSMANTQPARYRTPPRSLSKV